MTHSSGCHANIVSIVKAKMMIKIMMIFSKNVFNAKHCANVRIIVMRIIIMIKQCTSMMHSSGYRENDNDNDNVDNNFDNNNALHLDDTQLGLLAGAIDGDLGDALDPVLDAVGDVRHHCRRVAVRSRA